MNRRGFLIGALAASFIPAAGAKSQIQHHVSLSHVDLEILAHTVWGEARGECTDGQIAVAQVVFNRVASTDPLFSRDTSIRRACLRREQFDCWQHRRMMRECHTGSDEYRKIRETCHRAYYLFLAGTDLSRGATSYVERGCHPRWLRHVRRTCSIGKHIFFTFET